MCRLYVCHNTRVLLPVHMLTDQTDSPATPTARPDLPGLKSGRRRHALLEDVQARRIRSGKTIPPSRKARRVPCLPLVCGTTRGNTGIAGTHVSVRAHCGVLTQRPSFRLCMRSMSTKTEMSRRTLAESSTAGQNNIAVLVAALHAHSISLPVSGLPLPISLGLQRCDQSAFSFYV